VIYSTCSLEPEENEQVVTAVLDGSAKTRLVSLEQSIEGLAEEGVLISSGAKKLRDCYTHEGAIRLLPGVFHTDGFFIALIEKGL
jgi:16S rRNA (cytosine967-C5)-methyltransferase